jgi:hypothetical protein
LNNLTDKELLLLLLTRNPDIEHEIHADPLGQDTEVIVEITGEAGFVEFTFAENGRLLAVLGNA